MPGASRKTAAARASEASDSLSIPLAMRGLNRANQLPLRPLAAGYDEKQLRHCSQNKHPGLPITCAVTEYYPRASYCISGVQDSSCMWADEVVEIVHLPIAVHHCMLLHPVAVSFTKYLPDDISFVIDGIRLTVSIVR